MRPKYFIAEAPVCAAVLLQLFPHDVTRVFKLSFLSEVPGPPPLERKISRGSREAMLIDKQWKHVCKRFLNEDCCYHVRTGSL